MESEERALPEQETPDAQAESAVTDAAPAELPPAKSGESEGPLAAQALPGTPLEQFALEQELARGRRLLDEQLRIIQAVDPAVKGLEDLRAQPEFGRFDQLVKSGRATPAVSKGVKGMSTVTSILPSCMLAWGAI